jgi:hypothetical protein
VWRAYLVGWVPLAAVYMVATETDGDWARGFNLWSALYGTSQSNLRQVGQYLALYAGDNREAIVPTAFDYRANLAPGKVRTASPVGVAPPIGPLSVGSWVDILWTENSLGPIATNDDTTPNPWNYRFDSPDAAYYALGGDAKNVFRSAEAMQAIPPGGGTGATPFGDGAFESEKQNPGYFGGNPFFDGRPPTTAHPYSGRFWVTGQIKRPSASMYCMDAWVGELLVAEGTAGTSGGVLGSKAEGSR